MTEPAETRSPDPQEVAKSIQGLVNDALQGEPYAVHAVATFVSYDPRLAHMLAQLHQIGCAIGEHIVRSAAGSELLDDALGEDKDLLSHPGALGVALWPCIAELLSAPSRRLPPIDDAIYQEIALLGMRFFQTKTAIDELPHPPWARWLKPEAAQAAERPMLVVRAGMPVEPTITAVHRLAQQESSVVSLPARVCAELFDDSMYEGYLRLQRMAGGFVNTLISLPGQVENADWPSVLIDMEAMTRLYPMRAMLIVDSAQADELAPSLATPEWTRLVGILSSKALIGLD